MSDFTSRILFFTSVNSLSKDKTPLCVSQVKNSLIIPCFQFPVEIPPFLRTDHKQLETDIVLCVFAVLSTTRA